MKYTLKLKKNFHCWGIVLTILFTVSHVFSQDSLRTITREDYPQWQSLTQAYISEDGNWTAYHVSLVQGDDTLYVKNVYIDSTYKYSLANNPEFSSDSKWIAFRIGYSEKILDEMREKKETVQYKMGLVNLETGEFLKYDDIQNFKFSRTGSHIAMHKYKPKEKKSKGSDLILRNLTTGEQRNIGNVSEFDFNKKGDWLVHTIDADGKGGNGVELFDLRNNTLYILDSDTATFSQLTWEKEGNGLTFLHSFNNPDFEEDNHYVIAYRNIYDGLKKEVFNPLVCSTFPDTMRIIGEIKLVWAEDMSAVFFGIKEWTKKKKAGETPQDSTRKDSEKAGNKDKKEETKEKGETSEKLAGVDIWHWQDIEIQPRQKKTYETDKNFNYLSVWHINDTTFVQIADENMKYAYLTGNQKHAIGQNKKPYEPAFRLPYADYYIVDVITGERKKILHKFFGTCDSSPDGKYLLYFRDKHWWAYDIYNDRHNNLTEKIDTNFWNTRYDGPSDEKPPFGYAGWYKNDTDVLLYDEFNVWGIKPDGSGYKKLTDGDGEKIIFRMMRLDYEHDYLDPEEPLYFTAFGDTTKKSGYFRMNKYGSIEKLLLEDKRISRLSKAKKADKFVYVAETYRESPNVYYVDKNFPYSKKLSDTNPQQKNFLWGNAELIDFINDNGVALQGVLTYPANYNPDKKYPMIVYIYERLSNWLHFYVVPSAKSFYNITNFSSQGYFIFRPDIIYTVNQPGMSTVKCVIPAVKKVLEKGIIDENKIGIMGHSWGGYQTAFLVTQTDIFSAAVAGAPLIDLISMYLEVYWNTGGTNAVIFETSQGRFKTPFWENMEAYMNNSPLFNAQNIKTPLLVAFGDEDGAVDWHQGIEMFNSMRRMQKSIIMLVYSGENHANAKKENQLDYTERINEFFDHYLKGKDAPQWIKGGVPYLERKKIEEKKEKDKKLEK